MNIRSAKATERSVVEALAFLLTKSAEYVVYQNCDFY